MAQVTACTDPQSPELKVEPCVAPPPKEPGLEEELKRSDTTETEKESCIATMGTLVANPVLVKPDVKALRGFVVAAKGGEESKAIVVGIIKRGNKEISVIRETSESVADDTCSVADEEGEDAIVQ